VAESIVSIAENPTVPSFVTCEIPWRDEVVDGEVRKAQAVAYRYDELEQEVSLAHDGHKGRFDFGISDGGGVASAGVCLIETEGEPSSILIKHGVAHYVEQSEQGLQRLRSKVLNPHLTAEASKLTIGGQLNIQVINDSPGEFDKPLGSLEGGKIKSVLIIPPQPFQQVFSQYFESREELVESEDSSKSLKRFNDMILTGWGIGADRLNSQSRRHAAINSFESDARLGAVAKVWRQRLEDVRGQLYRHDGNGMEGLTLVPTIDTNISPHEVFPYTTSMSIYNRLIGPTLGDSFLGRVIDEVGGGCVAEVMYDSRDASAVENSPQNGANYSQVVSYGVGDDTSLVVTRVASADVESWEIASVYVIASVPSKMIGSAALDQLVDA
jgi:hypothetical protein